MIIDVIDKIIYSFRWILLKIMLNNSLNKFKEEISMALQINKGMISRKGSSFMRCKYRSKVIQ